FFFLEAAPELRRARAARGANNFLLCELGEVLRLYGFETLLIGATLILFVDFVCLCGFAFLLSRGNFGQPPGLCGLALPLLFRQSRLLFPRFFGGLAPFGLGLGLRELTQAPLLFHPPLFRFGAGAGQHLGFFRFPLRLQTALGFGPCRSQARGLSAFAFLRDTAFFSLAGLLLGRKLSSTPFFSGLLLCELARFGFGSGAGQHFSFLGFSLRTRQTFSFGFFSGGPGGLLAGAFLGNPAFRFAPAFLLGCGRLLLLGLRSGVGRVHDEDRRGGWGRRWLVRGGLLRKSSVSGELRSDGVRGLIPGFNGAG